MAREAAPTTGAGEDSFQLLIADDYRHLSVLAADIVADTIARAPGTAITLPTGDTPRGMYEELVSRIRAGSLDFTAVEFFCLDDYLGKGIQDKTSLTRWLHDTFLGPAGLDGPSIHLIPSTASDPVAAAKDYEARIVGVGGLELAVVGLGRNGHVGFNEPGSPIDSRTRIVDLTEQSRQQNAAYYDSDESIPTQAMTLGLGTVLSARRIVLIVSGAGKAPILREVLEGPVTTRVPGSTLRTVGNRLTVIADREAAQDLGTAPAND